jgi:serine/threonine-protein kinase
MNIQDRLKQGPIPAGEALDYILQELAAPSADVYSLGMTLGEMVTGTRPFQADPKLPAALNEIILLAIAEDPQKRFQSAAAFRAALESVRKTLPVVAPKARSSHRGLYMALGGLLVVAVLVVGAMQLPKWLKTRAVESPAPVQQAQPVAQPAEQPPVAPGPVQAQAPRPVVVPQAAPATPAPPSAAAAPEPPQALPAVDTAKADALREIQKSWPMLASRAGAVSTSLQSLQQQQQRSGYNLRGDIAASWKRMEHHVDQVDAALAAKDPDAARENMESAERELATLEKFLGR